MLELEYELYIQHTLPTVATSTPTPPTPLTWPPLPLPLPTPFTTVQPDRSTMLGLHNIFLIAPPHPSSSYPLPNYHQIPTNCINNVYTTAADDLNNIPTYTQQEYLGPTRKKIGQVSSFGGKKDASFTGGVEGECTNFRSVCRDCGNRAKKECEYRMCRTCCKNRGFDCATHMKSTWVPPIKKRAAAGADSASSGSSSGGRCRGGGKSPRQNLTTTSNSLSTSSNHDRNNNYKSAAGNCFNLDTVSNYQDASFKQSLPGKVQAPAVFRCIRVSAVNGGETDVAYQAVVNISGHIFKGFLYDQGIDEKNLFPCISKLQSSGGNKQPISPLVEGNE